MRHIPRLAAFAAAIALPVMSVAAVSEPAINAERLEANIRELASDEFQGRAIATEGERMTVELLTRAFAEAGFEPGGENGGWTQTVTLRRFEVASPTASITIGDWNRPLVQAEDVVISTRLPNEHVSLNNLPLIFVGYGTTAPERDWDDFKDVDVTGRIIVVLVNDADFEEPELNTFGGRAMTYYGRWTYKYEEAARRGAAGVLIVHETEPASYGWATVANSWTGPQFDIVRENPAAERVPLEGWIQRDLAVELFERAGLDFEALKVEARSRDFRPVVLEGASLSASYGVSTDTIQTDNVIARLPGSRYPNETILYTAHWDHLGVVERDDGTVEIFNGAVDNATGTAALIEVAHHFASGPRPERSIVLIGFTAEESGLLGSEFYAANPVWPLETTVTGFNMDAMNVYGRTTDLNINGYGQSADMDNRLRAAAAQQDRTIAPDTRAAAGIYFRSDHFPLAKRGVPMAYAGGGITFREEPVALREQLRAEYGRDRYHQVGDEWDDRYDLSGMIEDLELFIRIGQDLANSRDWPQWSESSEFGPARAPSAAARQ